ncbi:MAG: thymidine kinase [Agathobacter sp.]|nr:thymidine kinase [Agathobacter sp.]
MAKLYFRYGAMGSSKTANALMVEYNYRERGKNAVLVKPKTDNRDGEHIIKSRIGLQNQCIFMEELVDQGDEAVKKYDCIIVDEAQFCTKAQIEYLVHIVDDLHIPVICYGLRADFRNELFEGSLWLLAWADVIEEIRTVCWCGKAARCNARFNENGIIREGAQVVLGGNSSYVALCRKHLKEGNLGPNFRKLLEEFN